MTNYIKQWWQSTNDKSRQAEIKELRDSITLREKDGIMWILHNGVAIHKLPPFASSDEMILMLEEVRDGAVEYKYGKEKKEEEVPQPMPAKPKGKSKNETKA